MNEAARRIELLRKLMRRKRLEAWVVPSADPHNSEYVAPRWQRRAFITGFDGSAGTAVIGADWAGLWTDSRYFLQAERQLAGSGIVLHRLGVKDVPDWPEYLAGRLAAGCRVGLNPEVVTERQWKKLAEQFAKKKIKLVPSADLVDAVWPDRPEPPEEPVISHPLKWAGESTRSKLERLRKQLGRVGADAAVICALDEIAWLLNLRGSDIPCNPVFLSYLVVERRRAVLFTSQRRLSAAARRSLEGLVKVAGYGEVEKELARLGGRSARVWFDPAAANHRLVDLARRAGAGIVLLPGPVAEWKARKNAAELSGMRLAHLQEGQVLVRLWRWLEERLSRGRLSERDVVERIERLRAGQKGYRFPSFETIAAHGPNGAIVHYQVKPDTCRSFGRSGLLLVDTGAQYTHGTTDCTRTFALGRPTAEQKRLYTTVLKAHLALCSALFVEGTDGYQLDVIAREKMWRAGLHYGHGTGHGVGAALCVHEGPMSISMRKVLRPIEPGHVVSIEPGIYIEGKFGIRIENLAVVREKKNTPFGRFFGFEQLTLCPYQRELIDTSLLDADERNQVDSYHRQVFEQLAPGLEPAERNWLRQRCRPLG